MLAKISEESSTPEILRTYFYMHEFFTFFKINLFFYITRPLKVAYNNTP